MNSAPKINAVSCLATLVWIAVLAGCDLGTHAKRTTEPRVLDSTSYELEAAAKSVSDEPLVVSLPEQDEEVPDSQAGVNEESDGNNETGVNEEAGGDAQGADSEANPSSEAASENTDETDDQPE